MATSKRSSMPSTALADLASRHGMCVRATPPVGLRDLGRERHRDTCSRPCRSGRSDSSGTGRRKEGVVGPTRGRRARVRARAAHRKPPFDCSRCVVAPRAAPTMATSGRPRSERLLWRSLTCSPASRRSARKPWASAAGRFPHLAPTAVRGGPAQSGVPGPPRRAGAAHRAMAGAPSRGPGSCTPRTAHRGQGCARPSAA